jgi:hypothetical protein
MDLPSILLTCSLHFDDPLVRALAESNSHSNPYFVFDPSIDPTEVVPPADPMTLDGALARAQEVSAKHAVPLLGLMEVPPAWMAAFGRELGDAFDPCTNVAVGTAMLSQFDSECAHESGGRPSLGARAARGRRVCVLRKYAEALHMPELVTIVSLELQFQRPGPPTAFDAPIFAASSTGPWGPDRLFFPVSSSFLPPAVGVALDARAPDARTVNMAGERR